MNNGHRTKQARLIWSRCVTTTTGLTFPANRIHSCILPVGLVGVQSGQSSNGLICEMYCICLKKTVWGRNVAKIRWSFQFLKIAKIIHPQICMHITVKPPLTDILYSRHLIIQDKTLWSGLKCWTYLWGQESSDSAKPTVMLYSVTLLPLLGCGSGDSV